VIEVPFVDIHTHRLEIQKETVTVKNLSPGEAILENQI
jgi:hypothetical protein